MVPELPLKTVPESICILRLSALGDVCNMVPVVRTLQACWPQTAITWVIGQREHDLVGDIPGVEFIRYQKKTGLRGIWQLRNKLSGRHFSVLLLMQAALRASLLSLAIPARIRVGFHPQMAKDFQGFFTRFHTRALKQPHVIDGFFSFLEALGIGQRRMAWNIPVPENARNFVSQKLGEYRNNFFVISPCASVRYRNWRDWPAEKYARLIDHVYDRYGLRAVLTGGTTTHEVEVGRCIMDTTIHQPVNLIGRTSIKELMAVIEQAKAVVSPDSGPVHMANAMGVPPVGLYVTSNPERTGPYSVRKWVVNAYPTAVRQTYGKSVDDIPWGKRVRNPDAIELVTFNAVMKMLDGLFSERKPLNVSE